MQPALKRALREMFHWSGGLRLVRWRNRKGIRILMYHRFPRPNSLERQCRHFRRYYRPVSLSQVTDWVAKGDEIPANALVVTVDDGYRDFFETAYPVFQRYRIPATFFVATDFLDQEWLWLDRVRYAFAHSPLPSVEVALPEGPTLRFTLGTPAQRAQAAEQTCEAAIDVWSAGVEAFLKGLPRLMRTEIPAKPPEQFAPCRWDELRTMVRNGIEVGAHTRSHPILSRVPQTGELEGETAGSKARIENELQMSVHHFCYPNGRAVDISPEAVEAVRRAGFRSAVTTISGLNYPGQDCLLLRRIGMDPNLPEAYFRECAAAFRV